MLHREHLVFLGQLSQVTFNSILLHGVLITFVDPEVSPDTDGEGKQRRQPSVEVRGSQPRPL